MIVNSNYGYWQNATEKGTKRLPANQQSLRERSKMRLQDFLGRRIPTVPVNAIHHAVVEMLDGNIPHLDTLFGIAETHTRDRFVCETKPWLRLVVRGESRGRLQKGQTSRVPLLIGRVVFLRIVNEMASKRPRKEAKLTSAGLLIE